MTAEDAARIAETIANYRRALVSQPNSIQLHCMLAVALQQQGQLEAAVASYRQALSLKPDLLPAHVNLGNTLQALERFDEAATSYLHALNLMPESAELHCYLANVLHKQGRLDAALLSYRRALTLQPNLVGAHNDLANALQQLGQLDEAAAAYRRAIALQPALIQAHISLGRLLQSQNKLSEAVACFRQALAVDPALAEVHTSLGIALSKLGNLDEAIASHRNALSLQTDSAAAHVNLGVALYQRGDYDEAIANYRQALVLKPNFTMAHNNLGAALKRQGNLSAAVTSYRHALAQQPNLAGAHCNLSTALKDQGNVAEAIACLQQALALEPNYVEAYSDYLIAVQYLPEYPREQLLADHTAFAQRFEAPLRAHWPQHANDRNPQRRLKIGFVSGDLRTHPVGFFLLNVLRQIDRDALDITLYASTDVSDNLTAQLRALEFAWTPLSGLSDDAAAQRIRADGIDILVDLSGHTGENRLMVFARKPAPLQVGWLGYWATTGLQAIDYILCDRHGILADEAQFYVEHPWYLPDTRLCFTPPEDTIAIDTLPALRNGYVTFGCFNNPTKMTDAVVAVWTQILHSVADSRLFLKSKSLLDRSVQESVAMRFAAHGIGAERLLFEGDSEREEYFAAYNRVDIALDPFPFTGATTTIEGVWMGVPVLTRRGDRLVAHQGESILHNLALTDWIAADDAAYVAQAVARASDLDSLGKLRSQLRSRLLASPLCDAALFARNLELAFRGMWQQRCGI
jgi:predicted O-linked N-acetylglucosamine transferase (SPINDLY family)